MLIDIYSIVISVRRMVLVEVLFLICSLDASHIFRILGCSFILSVYIWLNLIILSLTYDPLKWRKMSLITYQGASTTIIRICLGIFVIFLYSNLTPYPIIEYQIFAIWELPNNLFSVDSSDLMPSNQCIFPSWSPSCFRLVNIFFLI